MDRRPLAGERSLWPAIGDDLLRLADQPEQGGRVPGLGQVVPRSQGALPYHSKIFQPASPHSGLHVTLSQTLGQLFHSVPVLQSLNRRKYCAPNILRLERVKSTVLRILAVPVP